MQIVRKSFLLLLALLTAAALLLSIRDRRQAVSEYENRALARHPEFSLDAVWDGSYFDGWDEYFSDHVTHRDDLMREYLRLQLYGKRSVLVNKVVITQQALLPELENGYYVYYDYRTPSEERADGILAVQEAAERQGARFLFVGVEEQRTALKKLYPSYVATQNLDHLDNITASFRAALEERGVHTLFTQDLFDEADKLRLYSRVDHHYNLYGAFETYRAICAAAQERGLSFPVLTQEEADIHPLDAEYNGSYNRKFYDLSPVTEKFLTFDTSVLPPYERWDYGEKTDAPVLNLSASGGKQSYADYMGGDTGETVIQTHRPELPDVLIVGDSFTNPIEGFCVYSFDEIRSLDFRYYTEKTLTEYLQDYPADLVVVIRDNTTFHSDVFNADLK